MVKPVIVSTDEYDVISIMKLFRIQNGSPNCHGYDFQIEYTSGGRAAKTIQNIEELLCNHLLY